MRSAAPVRLFLPVTIVLCLVAASSRLAATGPAEEEKGNADILERFSPEERERLLAGEAIFTHTKTSGPDGETGGNGEAAVLIDKPVETCFEIFCEFDKMQEYLPRKTRSEVVGSDGDKVLLEKELKVLFKRISFRSIYTIDPEAHRVEFELDRTFPHDIEDSAGYYQFDALDEDRTLFSYGLTRMDSGMPVPGFIQNSLASRDLPNVVLNVKKRIESGGTWTKD